MLGSFPPPRKRWSMEFYYPNITNDMWRILGIIFYGDKDYFLSAPKRFSREKAVAFCEETGLGLGDTAVEVIRHKANASDKDLEVVTPFSPEEVLRLVPQCEAIVITGQKAMDTILSVLPHATEPVIGAYTTFTLLNRSFRLYRMPSSSRAYPKPLQEKAEIYKNMFEELGMV
ncbi:uracil-DNA glycosylase family protein [Parabacteroides sp. OttesenSCG-928-G07]|nr:uracil-DNA glycosylase family protein [Parabacteroides sp. OttesenSCG-928-G07]